MLINLLIPVSYKYSIISGFACFPSKSDPQSEMEKVLEQMYVRDNDLEGLSYCNAYLI